MRYATQNITGPQGQRMTRTVSEAADLSGLQVCEVFDFIDIEWVREEYRRRVPLWRRVLLAIRREMKA